MADNNNENKDKNGTDGAGGMGNENNTDAASQDSNGDGAGASTQDTKDTSAIDTTPQAPVKKTVEVDAEVLEKLLNTVEAQGEQLRKNSDKIGDLTEAADLGRLHRIEQARMAGKLVKNAKVSMYEGKIVLGWSRIKDDVYLDEQNRLHEDQTIQLVLDEGEGKEPTKSEVIPYRTFMRVVTKVEGEVIGDRLDQDGSRFYKIKFEDGREMEFSIVFIN